MSNFEDFLNELLEVHPKLKSYYCSEQYSLSKKIIEIIVENSIKEDQLVILLNLDLEYINRITSGDNSIDTSEYERIVGILETLKFII